jgi:hypothetical protein
MPALTFPCKMMVLLQRAALTVESLYAQLPACTRGLSAAAAATKSGSQASVQQQGDGDASQSSTDERKIKRGSPEYHQHMRARKVWRQQMNSLILQWREELWQQHKEQQQRARAVLVKAEPSSSASEAAASQALEEELREAQLEYEVVGASTHAFD